MEGAMDKLDRFLIEDVCEPRTQWFQRLTGRDCFWVAKTLIVCWAALVCSVLVFMTLKSPHPLDFLVWVMIAAQVLFLASVLISFVAAQDAAYRAIACGLRNPAKIISAEVRKIHYLETVTVLACTFSIFPMEVIVDSGNLLPLVVTSATSLFPMMIECLKACDPLPPGQSTVGQWLVSLRRALASGKAVPQPA